MTAVLQEKKNKLALAMRFLLPRITLFRTITFKYSEKVEKIIIFSSFWGFGPLQNLHLQYNLSIFIEIMIVKGKNTSETSIKCC